MSRLAWYRLQMIVVVAPTPRKMHLGHTLLGNDTWRGYAVQVSAVVHNDSNFVHVRKHNELWKAPPAQAVEGRSRWLTHDITVPASKIDDMTATKNQQKIRNLA